MKGFLFIAPWLIGFIWFYARSLFMTVQFSFSNLTVRPGGGYDLDFVWLDNFIYAFRAHASYKQVLTTSIGNMLVDVPLITFFSLFMAMLLNRKFKGRTLVRAIFFLPVILNSEAIVDAMNLARAMMSGGISSSSAELAASASSGMSIDYYIQMFSSLGLPDVIIEYISGAVGRISDIINASGVQIIIFIAALQSIPGSMYEVAKIEGATAYETFWKVTFPMVMPHIITNIVYTVVDSFTKSDVIELAYETAFTAKNYGLSSVFSLVSTVITCLILVIVCGLIQKRTFYYNEERRKKMNKQKALPSISSVKAGIQSMKEDTQFANDRLRWISNIKGFILGIFRLAIILGICYVILGPVIGIISSSFFSDADSYNPMVYLIPQEPTLYRYELAIKYLDYWKTMGSSLLVCSMVGYGFARFNFPFKKALFACVVVMIVIPTNTIMLPLYMTFAQFDVFGIISAINGSGVNLLSTPVPMYILTLFGCGLRSGLYIYIFNQFFRGLPKEIEEAAFVDGAGTWYTYFRIMLVNALPSVVTVAIFSMVWQYNDTFYARLFLISDDIIISKKIASIEASISNVEKILDPTILELFLDAGIVLVMIPIIIIYVALQKQFIEGVERSGIVG